MPKPLDELLAFTKYADSWSTRQWPDPVNDGLHPSYEQSEGCTCEEGHKLDCPIHGLKADPLKGDMTWALPEASPVGYPQDQPRNWQIQQEAKVAEQIPLGWPWTAGTKVYSIFTKQEGTVRDVNPETFKVYVQWPSGSGGWSNATSLGLLTLHQRASAWDRSTDELSPVERAYVLS